MGQAVLGKLTLHILQSHQSFELTTALQQLGKLTEATLGLEQAHASKTIAAEILHAAEAITSSPAFRPIEDGINTAIDEVSKVEHLLKRAPWAILRRCLVMRSAIYSGRLIAWKSWRMTAGICRGTLKRRSKDLEDTKGRVSLVQEEARKHITCLKAAIKLKPWETELRNKRADFNSINTRVQGLLQTLDNIKEGVKVGDNLIRQVVKFMEKALS